MAQQNLAAMGHISETLQASVQSMSTALAAGQGTQQQTMEQRLQGLEASNARKLDVYKRQPFICVIAVSGCRMCLTGHWCWWCPAAAIPM